MRIITRKPLYNTALKFRDHALSSSDISNKKQLRLMLLMFIASDMLLDNL